MTEPACRLCLITPPSLKPNKFKCGLAMAPDAGGMGALHTRLKDTTDDTIRRATETLMPVARERDVPIILNDRPGLAADMGYEEPAHP